MKPARQIITRSPKRSVGAIHEPWFQSDPIHHETHLEKCCIELLLLYPWLKRLEHQPLKIRYRIDGKPREYTPDLRATLSDDSRVLFEFKGKPYVEEFRAKLAEGLHKALLAQGTPFFFLPSDLVDKRRVSLASELRSMARRVPPAGALDELLTWVAEHQHATVGDAEQAGFHLGLIGHAIGRRKLTVGPSFLLEPKQPLHLVSTYEHIHIDHWLGYPGRAEKLAP